MKENVKLRSPEKFLALCKLQLINLLFITCMKKTVTWCLLGMKLHEYYFLSTYKPCVEVFHVTLLVWDCQFCQEQHMLCKRIYSAHSRRDFGYYCDAMTLHRQMSSKPKRWVTTWRHCNTVVAQPWFVSNTSCTSYAISLQRDSALLPNLFAVFSVWSFLKSNIVCKLHHLVTVRRELSVVTETIQSKLWENFFNPQYITHCRSYGCYIN